jgi:large subunit ribosomal protein L13
MNTTVRIKASQIYKDWHVIDAAGRPLGRVATEAATLLRGKHKPTYERHLDDGDFVIIINASQVRVTGRKAEQNKYYTHSGYPGGLHTRSFEEMFNRHPERVIEKAVWGMLPGGPLGEQIFKHLKVYKGAHHPHESQITGSQKAQAARAEAQKAAIASPSPMRAPRLRTLSVPTVVVEPEPKSKPEAKATPAPAARQAPAAKAPRAKAPAAAEVTAPAEAPVVAEAAAPAEKKPARTKAAAPATTETATEAPKPRARRKAADATAEAPAESATEAKKPARKRPAAEPKE